MSTDIERLLYSERQYLRSFDFTDEQTYHLEMRRRLSRALHLWGIVKGLELLKSDVIQGAPQQFYISEGMAIDAYGREIIVPKIHPLAGELGNSRITGYGTYSVWIGYARERTTPAATGYQRCDLQNQPTRWRESFAIMISSTTVNPNPAEDPDIFGDLSDDPTKYPWWIHLGTINVDKSPAIAGATNADRHYIGLRAQRILAPRHAETEYSVLDANTPLDPLTSIAIRDNLFLEQNLITGSDFAVDPQKIQPPPIASPPGAFPNPTGNVKIASDVFLQGNLYTHCDPTQPDLWLNLDQCIRQRILNSVPEVHIGAAPIDFSSANPAGTSGTVTKPFEVSITTQLAQVDLSKTRMITSIASIHWKPSQPVVLDSPPPTSFQLPRRDFAASANPLNIATAWSNEGLQIDTSGGQFSLVSGSTFTATGTCSVTPAYLLNGNYEVPIDFVLVSYVVIFYPKT